MRSTWWIYGPTDSPRRRRMACPDGLQLHLRGPVRVRPAHRIQAHPSDQEFHRRPRSLLEHLAPRVLSGEAMDQAVSIKLTASSRSPSSTTTAAWAALSMACFSSAPLPMPRSAWTTSCRSSVMTAWATMRTPAAKSRGCASTTRRSPPFQHPRNAESLRRVGCRPDTLATGE